MGKHKKDRSRSRSRSHRRKNKESKHSKSRDRIKRHSRQSKFDLAPTGERVSKKSNWSTEPPKQINKSDNNDQQANMLFDAGVIKINQNQGIPENAITINMSGYSGPKEGLQYTQKDLFSKFLAKDGKEMQVSFLNKEDEQKQINQYNDILAQAGVQINPNINNQDKIGLSNPTNLFSFINPISQFTGGDLFTINSGLNPNIIATLNDPTKIKRKIYVPQSTFNYTGLIIGPKGSNQKRLEEETGCKILVRGKGSQKEGQPPQPDDDEPQHVLIVGDFERNVAQAVAEIERIIFADEETRNKIRQEQLKIVAHLKNDPVMPAIFDVNILNDSKVDLSLTTPYGPPSEDAYIIPVPNDCVGLVIGKGGETIKLLQVQSGARKVQVAADSSKGSNTRNVFVEGDKDSIEKVKRMIHEIVETQQKLKAAAEIKNAPSDQQLPNGITKLDYPVPNNLVGLIIGRGGDTIKNINQRTGAFVFIPKECEPGRNERVLTISGPQQSVLIARQEIEEIVCMGQRNLALKVAISQPDTLSNEEPILPMNSGPYQTGVQVNPQIANPNGGLDPKLMQYYMSQNVANPLEQASLQYMQQLYDQPAIEETIVQDYKRKLY